MSSLYNLEPPPTAKVILKTTAGDIELSLFAKQTPLASRNFLQHCLDGYYNNTIFHRLVPGFIIQGGDPTGTGSGGISAINNGDGFEDEVHSRLKFNRRGLLGMAKDEGGSNRSQFFFTLGVTPELQGKHTMFGRVDGDTIYNLMKMAEAELAEGEGSERPLYPTKITGSEILVNPFADMVARVREAPRTKDEGEKVQPKKRKKPAGKNVLSFGGDEAEDEAAPLLKKTKANPKLVSVGEEEPEKLSNTAMPNGKGAKKAEKKQRQRIASPEVVEMPSRPAVPIPAKKPMDDMESEDEEPEPEPRKQSQLERTNAEIAALKASMKRTVDTGPKEREKPKSALEAMIPETSTRGRKRGKVTDERGAMDLFKAFKQQLEDLPPPPLPPTTNSTKPEPNGTSTTNSNNPAPTTTAAGADNDDDEAPLCDLHFIANCQSCKSWDQQDEYGGGGDGEEDDDDDAGWMAHTLTFAKDTLGKDLEWKRRMAEIEVVDPREKGGRLREERGKEKGKKGVGGGRDRGRGRR